MDHISELLLTPTDLATRNLAAEGISGLKVQQVGDVMYDAAQHFGKLAERQADCLSRHGLTSKKYALATIHREESTNDRALLQGLILALEEIAERMPVIWPVHPRLRDAVYSSKLSLIKPVGYLEMQGLIKNARVVITDSGGLQKESFFHRVPCVTLREETEWVELVDSGWNQLAGVGDRARILECFQRAINGQVPFPNDRWYGNGDAANLIAARLNK